MLQISGDNYPQNEYRIYNLFADAEVAEDVAKDLVSGDIAGDGGEVVDALADVLAQEIARYAVLEALADAPDALLSLDK